MESFIQGHRIGQSDLVLNLYARYYGSSPYQSFPYTPVWIRYNVGFIHPVTGNFIFIGKKERTPDIIATGKIRPNFIIEDNWKPGVYEIRWYYRASEESATQDVTVEFSVTTNGMSQPIIYMGNYLDLNAYMVLC